MKTLHSYIKGDKVIWGIVVILSLVSFLAVYSASGSLAWSQSKSSETFLVKQIGLFLGGLAIIFFIHRVKYTRFARVAVILFIVSLPLLFYTLFFGSTVNDGSRWIRLPIIHLTFQTSDFARLALFLFLARQLSMRQDKIKDFKSGFMPVLVPVLLVCALIAPANLSTALLLGATCCILFFIGRVSLKHIFLLIGVGIVGVLLIYGASKAFNFGRGSTWETRIERFFGEDAGEDVQGADYQINQAKIAIASGQLIGQGPGNSVVRDYLPEAYSDFIFSIIVEEYGLLGGVALMMCYLLFLWRSILIFRRIPYAFGAFLAVALSFTLVFQALINMAINVHLLPVTGLTLPLVSMGGSSILFNCVAIGIILSVSSYVDEMEGKASKEITKQIKE